MVLLLKNTLSELRWTELVTIVFTDKFGYLSAKLICLQRKHTLFLIYII